MDEPFMAKTLGTIPMPPIPSKGVTTSDQQSSTVVKSLSTEVQPVKEKKMNCSIFHGKNSICSLLNDNDPWSDKINILFLEKLSQVLTVKAKIEFDKKK